jgi:hypothetical protein
MEGSEAAERGPPLPRLGWANTHQSKLFIITAGEKCDSADFFGLTIGAKQLNASNVFVYQPRPSDAIQALSVAAFVSSLARSLTKSEFICPTRQRAIIFYQCLRDPLYFAYLPRVLVSL